MVLARAPANYGGPHRVIAYYADSFGSRPGNTISRDLEEWDNVMSYNAIKTTLRNAFTSVPGVGILYNYVHLHRYNT